MAIVKHTKPFGDFETPSQKEYRLNVKRFRHYGMEYSLFNDGVYDGTLRLTDMTIHDLEFFTVLGVGFITGYFSCNRLILHSLRGCPDVGMTFNCSDNMLTSLDYCPRVAGNIYCYGNSITDIPKEFTHPISKLICDDIVREGYEYRRHKALEDF